MLSTLASYQKKRKEQVTDCGMITVQSYDKFYTAVSRSAAVRSQYLKERMAAENDSGILFLDNKFCIAHILSDVFNFLCDDDVQTSKEAQMRWIEKEVMKRNDHEYLFCVLMAADFLRIPPLKTAACRRVAQIISACSSPEEIRALFDIENDFDV